VARRRTTRGGVLPKLALTALLGFVSAPVLAAEEGAPAPNFGDLGQAIAALLIFGLLLAILGRYAWKPLLAQLRRREASIAEALRRSQEREQEAAELLKFHRARMEAVEAEAAEVISLGRKEAAEAREQVLTAAREETARMTAQAREEINRAKEAAVRELYSTAADAAIDLAERVIGKTLTDQDHARLVDESLEQLRRRPQESA
jgi:F-type H+-transporting ATPase subunit b